jgi:hypothetical protein
LQEELVSVNGDVTSIRADAPEHFRQKFDLERYVSVTGTKKKAVSVEEGEDPTYGSSQNSSSRLDTELRKESAVWILDYIESLFPQMSHHRETLQRCKSSAEQLFRNADLGWVLHDVDWVRIPSFHAYRCISAFCVHWRYLNWMAGRELHHPQGTDDSI